jgi:hypothetical protein
LQKNRFYQSETFHQLLQTSNFLTEIFRKFISDVLEDVSDISDGDIPDIPDKEIEELEQAEQKPGKNS